MSYQPLPAGHDPWLLTIRSGLTTALTGAQLSELAAHRYAQLQAVANQQGGRRPHRARGFAALRTFATQRATS